MIQTAQDLLRTTLSYSSNFQTLLGVGSQAAALARIYHDEFPKPSTGRQHTQAELEAIRPCGVVFTPATGGWQIDRDAMGEISNNQWNPSGVVHALIYRNVPSADKDDLGKVDTDFRTSVGDIVDDLVNMSETAGRLAIDRILAQGPYRTKPDELKAIGDAQVFELICSWGHR